LIVGKHGAAIVNGNADKRRKQVMFDVSNWITPIGGKETQGVKGFFCAGDHGSLKSVVFRNWIFRLNYETDFLLVKLTNTLANEKIQIMRLAHGYEIVLLGHGYENRGFFAYCQQPLEKLFQVHFPDFRKGREAYNFPDILNGQRAVAGFPFGIRAKEKDISGDRRRIKIRTKNKLQFFPANQSLVIRIQGVALVIFTADGEYIAFQGGGNVFPRIDFNFGNGFQANITKYGFHGGSIFFFNGLSMIIFQKLRPMLLVRKLYPILLL
jgi:hypothetical protein